VLHWLIAFECDVKGVFHWAENRDWNLDWNRDWNGQTWFHCAENRDWIL